MTRIVDDPCPEQDERALRQSVDAASTEPEQITELTVLEPGAAAWVTVIVPTRDERDSVAPLLERLGVALIDIPAEVLFVDDSVDGTGDAIRASARNSGLAIRLLHRAEPERVGGLGGAVVAGLQAVRTPWVVVMDADLQHPPELISRMVAIGQAREVDLVVASRKLVGGGNDGLDGLYRRGASDLATRTAKTLFPRRLAMLSDPMSGFFAVRTAALDLAALRPVGFKILLEIAVRHRQLRVAEVPFTFGIRVAGESKASAREGMRFARHLCRLRFQILRSQMRSSSSRTTAQQLYKFLLFGLVGTSGIVVNEAALWLFIRGSAHYLIGAILATEASTLWNFVLTDRLVFRGAKPGTTPGRFIRFAMLNHVALLLRLPILTLLVETMGISVLAANLVTLSLLFVLRFLIADGAIYAQPPAGSRHEPRDAMRVVVHPPALDASAVIPPVRHPRAPLQRYLPYRYSIDSVLTIGSQVPLPELEYFRAQWVGNTVDLSIRIGAIGTGSFRHRALLTQFSSPPAVTYEEHFGRLGANFEVRIGTSVEVLCSPALARSPHVLYTNVIEALLRFIAVSRGVVLLHSACLDLDGTGMLISARTDTGKTGTVLRMLRDRGARFLSDDMTLIHSGGKATCFPKPLTISHHTLLAVQAGDLTRAEWRRLHVQSRLHSKEGRDFGMVLAGLNIPIMGINAMTQRIIPPPKYAVDRLIDCQIVGSTQVSDLFVIERGPAQLGGLTFAEMIETLITNTDDAYGFPPFRQLAPSIVIGTDDYLELRRKERALLSDALHAVQARRITVDDYSWPDKISAIMAERTREAV